eukprot:7390849-Prymnesium_polylepis.2
MPTTPSAPSSPLKESHSLRTTSRVCLRSRVCTSPSVSLHSSLQLPERKTPLASPCVARCTYSLLRNSLSTRCLVASPPKSVVAQPAPTRCSNSRDTSSASVRAEGSWRRGSCVGSPGRRTRHALKSGSPTTTQLCISVVFVWEAARRSSSTTAPTDGAKTSRCKRKRIQVAIGDDDKPILASQCNTERLDQQLVRLAEEHILFAVSAVVPWPAAHLRRIFPMRLATG